MNDAEVEEQIKKHFERQTKELDLERELYQKLRNILPARKIAKLPMAERLFRESLVRKVKEMKDKKEKREKMHGEKRK
jgi:demethoxyubiquinone hydroxylase (CLK1/Coq7/Cat5 family)